MIALSLQDILNHNFEIYEAIYVPRRISQYIVSIYLISCNRSRSETSGF